MYPAGLAGTSARFVFLPSGLNVRVVEAGPADGSPVVLLHGWGACVYTFRAALPALGAAGFRAIAIDLPGHGLSDKPRDPAIYTRAGLTNVVRSVLDALQVRGACVVGQSMGGAIALELAISRDPIAGRIVLIDPVGLVPLPLVKLARVTTLRALAPLAQRFLPRAAVGVMLRLAYADASRVSERDVDEYWAPSQFRGYAEALIACLHAFSWEPFAPETLAAVRCPVLLVEGTFDHLVRDPGRGARTIPGLRVARVAGGHAVNEECPHEVNAALVAFARE